MEFADAAAAAPSMLQTAKVSVVVVEVALSFCIPLFLVLGGFFLSSLLLLLFSFLFLFFSPTRAGVGKKKLIIYRPVPGN